MFLSLAKSRHKMTISLRRGTVRPTGAKFVGIQEKSSDVVMKTLISASDYLLHYNRAFPYDQPHDNEHPYLFSIKNRFDVIPIRPVKIAPSSTKLSQNSLSDRPFVVSPILHTKFISPALPSHSEIDLNKNEKRTLQAASNQIAPKRYQVFENKLNNDWRLLSTSRLAQYSFYANRYVNESLCTVIFSKFMMTRLPNLILFLSLFSFKPQNHQNSNLNKISRRLDFSSPVPSVRHRFESIISPTRSSIAPPLQPILTMAATQQNCQDVESIRFSFSESQRYPNMATSMATAYGDTFDNAVLNTIFTINNAGDRTGIKTTVPNGFENIKTAILNLIAEDAITTPGTDANARRLVINNTFQHLPLKISVHNNSVLKSPRFRGINNLHQAVIDAAGQPPGQRTITIWVDINSLWVDPDRPVDYLNWSLISHDSNTFSAPVVPNMSFPTATDIGTAIVTAFTTAGVTGAAGAAARTGAGHPISTVVNVNILPAPMRARYDTWIAGTPIRGSSLVPFPNVDHTGANIVGGGLRYYQFGGTANNNFIILCDGTLYDTTRPVDSKGILKNPILCLSNDFAGIRGWYDVLTTHALDNGHFIPPFRMFRPDAGGEWGFTFADDDTGDLPARLRPAIDRMKVTVWKLLSTKDMFPSGSNIPDIISRCYGDGYRAIKEIMFHVHPAFQEQPSLMVRNFPKQTEDMPVLQYYNYFKDFIKLRALILDVDQDLNTKNMKDIFIGNLYYSGYINRIYSIQGPDPAHQDKWTDAQLVETIHRLLRKDGSPALASHPPPLVNRAQVNRIDIEEFADAVEDPPSDDWAEELDSIPTTSDEEETVKIQYIAAVRAIKTQPQAAFSGTCLVCRDEHDFDHCPVLLDCDFLKKHYIDYCRMLRKQDLARKAAFQGSAAKLPVNQVSSTPRRKFYNRRPTPKTYSNPEDENVANGVDFQKGRL